MNNPIDVHSTKGWLWRLRGDPRLVAVLDQGGLFGVPSHSYHPFRGKIPISTKDLIKILEDEAGPIDKANEADLRKIVQKVFYRMKESTEIRLHGLKVVRGGRYE
jgi:hypothetical protein